MKFRFISHFSHQVIEIVPAEGPVCLATQDDVSELRKKWTDTLRKWHKPYVCLWNCQIAASPELADEFARLIRFFRSFHMKEIVGYQSEPGLPVSGWPFAIHSSRADAAKAVGLAETGPEANAAETVVVENHFDQAFMDVSLRQGAQMTSATDLIPLRSALVENIMLWHRAYIVLIDISEVPITAEARAAAQELARFLRGFFCQDVLCYGENPAATHLPFRHFATRHEALEHVKEHKRTMTFGTSAASCAARDLATSPGPNP